MGILASKTMPFLFKGSVLDLYQIAIPHQIKPRQTPILNATRLAESGRSLPVGRLNMIRFEWPLLIENQSHGNLELRLEFIQIFVIVSDWMVFSS